MRCLALAGALSHRGWTCRFLCSEETTKTIPQIVANGYAVTHGDRPPEGAADLLIVDHYNLDNKFERECRSWAARIMVIDDLANRTHDCDVLLDMTYGRSPADYDDLTPAHCIKLIGPRYALLRSEFRAARKGSLSLRRTNKGKLRRIFVFISTSGFIPQTGTILTALASYDKAPLIVDAIVQATNLDLEGIFKNSPHTLNTHEKVANISTLMAAADLAIGAGGVTSWERCCLGLPSVIIQIADNQKMNAEELGKCGAAINLGTIETFSPAKLHNCLDMFIDSPKALIDMSEIAAEICDGNGIDHVLPWLYKAIPAKDGNPVSLRRMDKSDEDIIFAWQQAPGVRQYMRNPKSPTRAEHQIWMAQKLEDAECKPYIIIYKGNPAGTVRLDRLEKPDAELSGYEVSILVDPALSGKNIALAALRLIKELEPKSCFYAWVNKGNIASQKLFVKAGYEMHKSGWYVLSAQGQE